MKWYVKLAPKDRRKFYYEGKEFESDHYTVGLLYSVLFPEDFVKEYTGEENPKGYREATTHELAWGAPVMSELFEKIPIIERHKIRWQRDIDDQS